MNDIERYGLRPQVAAALQADMGTPEEKTSLSDVLHVLRKRKGTILGLAAGTFALTAALTLLQTPIYQAKTRLLVQQQKGGFGGDNTMPILAQLMGSSAAGSVGTEVEVLQGGSLVASSIVGAARPHIQGLPHGIAARDRHRIALLNAGETPAVLAQLDDADRRDQAMIDNEVARRLDARQALLEDPQGKLPVKDPKLTVESVRDTDMVAIAVEDPDRDRAQNMANSLTAIYLDQNRRLNSASARKARQFVEAQMDEVKNELTRAEEEMKRYKERTRSVDITEETKQEVTRLADLGAQEKAAESEYRGLEASVAAIQRQLLNTPGHVQSSTLTVRNPVIGELEKQVAALEVQRA